LYNWLRRSPRTWCLRKRLARLAWLRRRNTGLASRCSGLGSELRQNFGHSFVIRYAAKRVLAETPSSHVSLTVGLSRAPRKSHWSIGRNNCVLSTTSISNSVAIERE
jgi:hypothetical protein